jgi:DNA (cytosine-5)-methyltransferase 1
MKYMPNAKNYPDLIEPIRRKLLLMEAVFVIENVVGASLHKPIKLCGSSFGLGVRRHRLFESNRALQSRKCVHDPAKKLIGVYGSHPEIAPLHRRRDLHRGRHDGPREYTWRICSVNEACKAMGIDWMNWKELTQAIPPAYSEFIGKQFLAHNS